MLQNKKLSILTVLTALLLGFGPAQAITLGAFGAFGEGGSLNGQSFTIGPGGVVFEIDSFVSIGVLDLNGGFFGTSAQLSLDPLPAGLDFAFSSSLSADVKDLILTYQFTNNTKAVLPGFMFLSFLDAEIDESTNTFFNEVATTTGALAAGQDFEVDEPDLAFGDIFDNLLLGKLDNSNAFGPPGDVSMALSFAFGDLGIEDIATINIMISEGGNSLGPFSIAQTDPDSSSITVITYSGVVAAIPEPATLAMFALGLFGIALMTRRRRVAIRR